MFKDGDLQNRRSGEDFPDFPFILIITIADNRRVIFLIDTLDASRMNENSALHTSNLLLLTAIFVCGLLGLLTLLPGFNSRMRVPRTSVSEGTPSDNQTARGIVLSMSVPQSATRRQQFSSSTGTAAPGDTMSERTESERRTAERPIHDASVGVRDTRTTRPRAVVRTNIVKAAAESTQARTTSRSATAEEALTDFKSFGADVPYVYVPVTVHPVTVNVDNNGVATELSKIQQSLEHLVDTRKQQLSPSGSPAPQTPAMAAADGRDELWKRLDQLDQSIQELKNNSEAAAVTTETSDSSSIVITPFQARQRNTGSVHLRPVPMPVIPSDKVSQRQWNVPEHASDRPDADAIQLPPGDQTPPSAPPSISLPAVPDGWEIQPEPQAELQHAPTMPLTMPFRSLDDSRDSTEQRTAQRSDTEMEDQKALRLQMIQQSNENSSSSRAEADPSVSRAVFQHTYRFAAPADQSVQQTAMTKFPDPPEPARPQTPDSYTGFRSSILPGTRQSVRSTSPHRKPGATHSALYGPSIPNNSESASDADTEKKNSLLRGFEFLKSGEWIPDLKRSDPAASVKGPSSSTISDASQESRIMHRAASAVRFATRPRVLP